MKKLLALLLAVCMILTLASCGNPAKKTLDKQLDYITKLAKAVDKHDDDKIEDIMDDIEKYYEKKFDKLEDLNDSLEDKYEDKIDDYEEEYYDNADDLKDSTRKTVDEALSAVTDAAEIYAVAGDASKTKSVFKDYVSFLKDIAKLSEKEKDNKIKAKANKLIKKYEKVLDQVEDLEDDYEEKIEDLEDKYGEDEVQEAIGYFFEAQADAR